MADNTSGFDGMDDLTAQLCITLQLEDIQALIGPPTESATPLSDPVVALQLQVAELKAYRVARGLPEIMRFTCIGCDRGYNADDGVTAPCQDHYCGRCIERLFSESMRDRTLYPPRCHRRAIPWEDVRACVSGALVTRFEGKREELEDTNPVYCHEQRCSAYIGAAGKDTTKATCSTCTKATCIICRQGAHEGACPQDEEVQKMRKYAKQEGNQECTQCHQLVELSTGCNHITCLCKYEFCYCCGVKWKECSCDQWDEDRLVARADHVANRPGMGGADAAPAIVEQLRQNHRDCDIEGHGYMERVEGRIPCDGCLAMQYKFIFRCYHCHLDLCYRCKNNRA